MVSGQCECGKVPGVPDLGTVNTLVQCTVCWVGPMRHDARNSHLEAFVLKDFLYGDNFVRLDHSGLEHDSK